MSRPGSDHGPVLAVTGLLAEARIAGGSGVVAVAGGGDAGRLAARLQVALDRGARAVISFGIAGGLASSLTPGTVVVARSIRSGADHWPTDGAWRQTLLSILPQAVAGDVFGVDAAVAHPGAKAELHQGSNALAVDMESHVAARLAARHGVPFMALRVVADPAHRGLPRAALVGMRPDGGTHVPAVLRALVRRPHDLPALLRTARDAQVAFAALRRARAALGSGLGFEIAASTLCADGADVPGPAIHARSALQDPA